MLSDKKTIGRAIHWVLLDGIGTAVTRSDVPLELVPKDLEPAGEIDSAPHVGTMDWLWLMLIGLVTGAYGLLVGSGGALILGPVFLIFFGLEPPVVAGTALALVAVNSFSGALTYRRMGLVDVRSGLIFAAAAIPGSVLAPFFVTSVAGGTFRILFGLLLIAVAFQILIRNPAPEDSPKKTKRVVGAAARSREITTGSGQVFRYEFNESLATAFNFVLGFISSFFGTGGGFCGRRSLSPLSAFQSGSPLPHRCSPSPFTRPQAP